MNPHNKFFTTENCLSAGVVAIGQTLPQHLPHPFTEKSKFTKSSISLANANHHSMPNAETCSPFDNRFQKSQQDAVMETQPIHSKMTTQSHFRLPKVSIAKEPQAHRPSLDETHSSCSNQSRSPTSSSSSLCDNTSAISKDTPQSQKLAPDPEHDIIENWFEVEFQQQFKRLNGLIQNTSDKQAKNIKNSNNSAPNDCIHADNSSEILFLRQKIDFRFASPFTANQFVIPSSSSSYFQSQNGSNVNRSQTDSAQLTSWLMGRKAGGSGVEATLKNQTIHEERAFEPVMLRPKIPKNSVQLSATPTSPDQAWITSRLLQIEQLLQWDAIPEVENIASSYSNLICLAITEPNEKANQPESILYAYPPAKTAQSKTNGSNLYHLSNGTNHRDIHDPSLIDLGGMFITLSEVLNILRITPQIQQQQQPSASMQTCCLQVKSSKSGHTSDENTYFSDKIGNSKHHQLTSRTYFFTSICYTFCTKTLMSKDTTVNAKCAKTKKSPTILLLVGLPKDNGFTENDSKCVAQMIDQTLVHRFKTVQAAFEPYFCFSDGSYHLTSHLLNQRCLLLDTLISPPPSQMSNPSSAVVNCPNTLETQLTLANTFFSFSSHNPATILPLRHLPFDESASLQTCKLLNYFDSLDWLDEAIGRFYKRDSMDLEHALSEHFARCLQWPPDLLPDDDSADNKEDFTLLKTTSPKSNKVPFENRADGVNNNKHQNTNNSKIANEQTQLFDLLEVELSSFVVVGSAIFYRGLLVQSNISHSMLNYVHQTLWSKGFTALTKFLLYDLLYFTKIDEKHLEPLSTNSKTHTFFMVLGQGHLLHCTLFQVYAFDKSNHSKIDFSKNLNSANGFMRKQQATTVFSNSLPSSFAFYVFIKESFRFLCFHLHCMNNNILSERIEPHLEQTLENNYRFGMQLLADNFLFFTNNDNKKAKKTLEKLIKETKKRSKSEKRKSVSSVASESGIYPSNARKSSSQKVQPSSARSVPATPIKSRPQSLYSNWSFTGSNYSANQSVSSATASTASSVTSLTESCQCSERSGVGSLSGQPNSISTSNNAVTCDHLLLHRSVYRFSHRYLPESLILYLNVEPTCQQETFYGPILDGGQFASLFANELFSSSISSETKQMFNQQPNHLLINSVITELVAEIRRFQTRLLKLAELDWNRQKGKPFPQQNLSPFCSGHIVTLDYDLITGKKITPEQLLINNRNSNTQLPTFIASIRFYLLGKCFNVNANKPLNQFYACFKINNNKNSDTISELMTKSNRSSKWSLGKLSLKLDIKSNSSFSSKKADNFSQVDRSNDYETIRLDNLRIDFEELIETVRFSSAN